MSPVIQACSTSHSSVAVTTGEALKICVPGSPCGSLIPVLWTAFVFRFTRKHGKAKGIPGTQRVFKAAMTHRLGGS